MNFHISQAHTLPAEVDVVEIADDAATVAFTLICERLKIRGYPVTGDVSPAEDNFIDEVFGSFVRMMALNNRVIADMQDAEPDWVGNVIGDDEHPLFRDYLSFGRFDEGTVWFDTPLPIHDKDDPEDGALYLLYADGMGLSGTVLATNAGSADELERRVMRVCGPDATIDDCGEALLENSPKTGISARARAIGEELVEAEEQQEATNEALRILYYDMPEDLTGVFDPTDETFGPILAALQRGDFEWAKILVDDLLDKPGMYVITERKNDPEINPFWFGFARSPLNALDRWADKTEFARHRDMMNDPTLSQEEKDGLIYYDEDGVITAIHTNTQVFVLEVPGYDL